MKTLPNGVASPLMDRVELYNIISEAQSAVDVSLYSRRCVAPALHSGASEFLDIRHKALLFHFIYERAIQTEAACE
jgi:hypothetical protein